jgi:CheY-like chemotaxis protein
MVKDGAQGKIILVVDDDESYRDVIARSFEANGLKVLLAKDGTEALSVCELMQVDVIITDIFMPKMDGIDLSRALSKTHPQIKIFFSSAAYPPKALEGEVPRNRFLQKTPNFKTFVRTFLELVQEKEKNEISVCD